MDKLKIKYLIMVVVFIVGYIVIAELIFKNRSQSFYESDLQGRLIEIYSSRDGIKIRINNDKSFRFSPIKSFDMSKDFMISHLPKLAFNNSQGLDIAGYLEGVKLRKAD